jgi:hypothetical protein
MSLEMISEKIQRSSCRPGPTRVSPVTLRSEFEHRGIVRGALLFLPASDALAMVKGARELGVPIYGVDGFWITDDTTQPDLGHSIDLGSGVGTSWDEAAHFISQRSDLGLMFEIVEGD